MESACEAAITALEARTAKLQQWAAVSTQVNNNKTTTKTYFIPLKKFASLVYFYFFIALSLSLSTTLAVSVSVSLSLSLFI